MPMIERDPLKPACDRSGLSTWCNGRDVKTVQLRSQCAGPAGGNEYLGAVVQMCSECRKANNGRFKIVKAAAAA